MHISRVELENIKSHVSSTFNFGKGTTAITGENGAGKTTIIEAIAWALFDLLDYKKEDFLRRGAKKGSVRVAFESGLDEREYVVYRDTAAGYSVTDPRLTRRVADKKDEVVRFLWQHLGLEPGTDLRALFRQAIGVPQGTFTAVFLEGAAERKAAFDKLLKVEEYRQAAEKLRDTSKFIEFSLGTAREAIARAEGELSRSEAVEAEHKTLSEQVAAFSVEVETVATDIAAREKRVQALNEQEQKVAHLASALDRARSEREKAELLLDQAEKALARSTDAATKVFAVRADHERHVATLGRLRGLERERASRDTLRAELAKTDAAIANVRAEQKRLDQELKKIAAARTEIEALRPKAEEQALIEKDIARLRDLAANAKTSAERVVSIDAELARMRDKFRENREKLREAEEKAALAVALETLEKRNVEIVTSLATLRATLERDRQFQSQIQGGFCPILSEKCLNLKEGETLESFLTNQFTDVSAQIETLVTEQRGLQNDLTAAREGSRLAAAIESYRQRDAELKEEGAGLTAKKEALTARISEGADAEAKIAELEARLTMLADPAARIRVLGKEEVREPEVRASLGDVESNLERLESERKQSDESLVEFRDLDQRWSALVAERDATDDAHRTFLANEAEAAVLEKRKTDAAAAATALASMSMAVTAAKAELASVGGGYDREVHERERAELRDAERRAAEIRATLDAARRREEQLAAELARFTELRKSLGQEFREKERLEKIGEATSFIRDTLKEAAPRVARNYVHHVSLEANQLFREITGSGERTLKWGEDYAVTLEEEGYERPFQSLSGGEQMAAALSIRLALLKQLSDIRIAFFDEPTTNLDAERRENFALEISRVKNFDQLFVISHDETFDSYVDHVVSVQQMSVR